MRIINSGDIMETIEMLTEENLDVRTVTMGISLLDCIDPDAEKACEKIYNKIVRLAATWCLWWTASAPSTVFPSSTSASA